MAIDAARLRRRRPSETAPRSLNATPQRPATAPPPGGDNATDFYGRINLAKTLTARPDGQGKQKRLAQKHRLFHSNEQEIKINYIAIAATQYCCSRIFTGPHVHFSPAIDLCGPGRVDRGCMFFNPRRRLHLLPPSARAKSSPLHRAQQHVAGSEHV